MIVGFITHAERSKTQDEFKVKGHLEFNLFAIWAMNDLQEVRKRYIGQVYSAIAYYKALLDEPTVIIGDFNWNAIWDAAPDYPLYGTLTDIIKILESKKIRSVYHEFYNEGSGKRDKADPVHVS